MLAKRFPDRVEIAAARVRADELEPGATDESETLRLAGRVLARRDLGKIVFLDLVDRSGRIQLLVREQVDLEEVDLNLGDIVGVSGHPAKSRRGEPSLQVSELELLAKIRVPLPDTFHGLTDVEQRYRRRYLDLLINEETRRSFEIRTRAVTEIRSYLDEEGFLEVETPVLQPRYGGGFATPFSTHYNELGQDMYLRIATELYLKRLIVGGLERVYELGKDFRNEGFSYKNSPEFTMLEWYEAYADYRDAMVRMETLVERVATVTLGTTSLSFRGHQVDVKAPWRRLRLEDALAEHGLWLRDPDELRAALDERGVDTSHDHTWAQLTDHALGSFVEPSLIEPTILFDYPVELSPFARATDRRRDARRAFRILRRRLRARQRLQRDQRRRGAGGPLSRAARGEGRRRGRVRRGRPRLCRGALLRDAAHRGPRARNRPAGDAPHRERDDPGRDPLPGAEAAIVGGREWGWRLRGLAAPVLVKQLCGFRRVAIDPANPDAQRQAEEQSKREPGQHDQRDELNCGHVTSVA